MTNAPAEHQLEFNKKLAMLMMENKVLNDRKVQEVPTYPTIRSSLIILDEHDKNMRPFKTQKRMAAIEKIQSNNTKIQDVAVEK